VECGESDQRLGDDQRENDGCSVVLGQRKNAIPTSPTPEIHASSDEETHERRMSQRKT
jgi:hypothetical protein